MTKYLDINRLYYYMYSPVLDREIGYKEKGGDPCIGDYLGHCLEPQTPFRVDIPPLVLGKLSIGVSNRLS